jgi:hypothetical protein
MLLVEVSESFVRRLDEIRTWMEHRTGYSFNSHNPSELLNVLMDALEADNLDSDHVEGKR